MDKEYRFVTGNVALRKGENGNRVAYGTAVVFDQPSHQLGYFREAIAPGAFDEYLRDKPELLALCHHDMRSVVGRFSAGTLRYTVDETGINIECDLPNTSYANDIAENLARRDVQGMSFAFDAIDDEWSMKDSMPFRYVKRAKVYEFSFVTDPAYPQTIAGISRSREHYAAKVEAVKQAGSLERWRRKLQLHRGYA